MADIYTTITGNLTRDPELKHTQGGKAVLNVDVAQNHRVKDAQGNWGNGATTFVSGTVWEDLALNVADSLRKGQEVLMTGWLYTEAFTRRDGTEGTALKMRVEAIGPSLRWGTTAFSPVNRRNGGAPQGAPQGGWGQPQGQPAAPQDPWAGEQQPAWGEPQPQDPPF